jgi:hypothetical protein
MQPTDLLHCEECNQVDALHNSPAKKLFTRWKTCGRNKSVVGELFIKEEEMKTQSWYSSPQRLINISASEYVFFFHLSAHSRKVHNN